jgi:nitroreductase
MAFKQSVLEVIKRRSSYRTYDRRPIDEMVLAQLKSTLEDPPASPFGTQVHLAVLQAFDPERAGIKKLGTYGIIRGVQNFIVGAVENSGMALEDFGFLLEWAILVATDLGLNTCWLGGTLKRDAFGQAVGAGPEQVVPAVAAVGYARSRRSLLDATMRLAVGSANRRPWPALFFSGNFEEPLTEEAAGRYAPAIESLRLAPSASNKQPWRIVAEPHNRRFHFFLRSNPGYQRVFAVDLQRVDMGIAMGHFDLAAKHLGLPGRWDVHAPDVGRLPFRTRYVASWIGEDN